MIASNAFENLQSGLPSERMKAAEWAVSHTLDDEQRRLVTEALSRERVPRIRDAFSAALRNTDLAKSAPAISAVELDPQESLQATLQDLGSLIQHEMEPAIGWIRHAANQEVREFGASATNRAVEGLRRRVDGLVKLANAQRLPEMRLISLAEVVTGSLSSEYPRAMFSFEISTEGSDEILTDPGLLSLIVSNALQNAADASRPLAPEEGQILVSTGTSEDSFWLAISNRFVGAAFDLDSVAASGRTSKVGHRGLGTRVMQLAAGRLGYKVELRAVGSTANFTLRGKRYG
ncbi:hypothetical protein GCM10009633_11690 [Janibacter melonis]